ncbi:hypothetical protein EXIGLDRAFT_758614 [Exidia glandulosa HHB12029]|uniref:Uncharacterized protein n=1 Tax=Exidia glandulosa HHB12029 TaxID=1314781 RepID=A0A165R0G9_EXIGL|nr:hypothetical protein EXIGLDRAFT_758614 [Exidia glandulosa HHB12029]
MSQSSTPSSTDDAFDDDPVEMALTLLVDARHFLRKAVFDQRIETRVGRELGRWVEEFNVAPLHDHASQNSALEARPPSRHRSQQPAPDPSQQTDIDHRRGLERRRPSDGSQSSDRHTKTDESREPVEQLSEIVEQLDITTIADLDEPARKIISRAATKLTKAVQAARRKDKPEHDAFKPYADALGQEAMTPEDFIRQSVVVRPSNRSTALVDALIATSRGIEMANRHDWMNAYQAAVGGGPPDAAVSYDFDFVKAGEPEDSVITWARLEQVMSFASKRGEAANWGGVIRSKILAIRFAMAWEVVSRTAGGQQFFECFYRQCYYSAHPELLQLDNDAARQTLLRSVPHIKQFHAFRQARYRDNAARTALLDALHNLGYMVLLDARWTLQALRDPQTQYADKARAAGSFFAELAAEQEPHPLTESQDAIVQALLSICYLDGGDKLAGAMDELVRDTCDDVLPCPWSSDDHDARADGDRSLLIGKFARPPGECPPWDVKLDVDLIEQSPPPPKRASKRRRMSLEE